METSWHSYPKIYALGHRAVRDIFNEPVVVEEKVDGSQFSFGVFDGELKIRSKGADILPDQPPKLFGKCVENVLLRKDYLVDGFTYRGECLDKPKHNALAYDRVPSGNVILFDINSGYESYLHPAEKKNFAAELQLEAVPVLHEGWIEGPDQIREMLSRVSVLGGQLIEGVVIKNYERFTIEKTAMLAKYVSESFKEVHRKAWKQTNADPRDVIQKLIDSYKTEARWNKAIQHLRERGELTNSPQDIGKLIIEVKKDTLSEEKEEIKRQLWKWAGPRLERGIVAGLPEWYKERLLESQFEPLEEAA